MMISLNEKMPGSGQGGQGARAGEVWGVGGANPTKQKQKSDCVAKAAKQSKGHCKAAVPDLEQAQEAPGPGTSEQCIHL